MKQLFVLTLIGLLGLKIASAQGTATGVISFTETITLNPDQTQVNISWPDGFQFTNEQYFLYVRAWQEENIDGKTVQIENGIYDFSKSLSGFSLQVKNQGGKLNYYAVEASSSLAGNQSPHQQSFIAAQGQTRFSLDHTPSETWIWLNGLLQFPGVWSTESKDIVLATPANAGDQLDVYYKEEEGQGGTDPLNFILTVTAIYLNDANSSNSGSVLPDSQQYATGTTINLNNDFTNTGDNFVGFFLNRDGTNPVTSIEITQNTTVYAVYDYTEPSSSSLLNGLISCWGFEETSGTMAADSHGNNHGTNSGATMNQAGLVGQSYLFDGIDDRVVVPYNTDFDMDYMTMFARFKVNRSGGKYQIIAGRPVSNTSHSYPYFNYALIVVNDASLTVQGYATVGGSRHRPAVAIPENTWVTAIMTYDGDNLTIRTDNGTPAVNSSPSGVLSKYSTDFKIGDNGGDSEPFMGNIDQIAIWNRVLTEQEIQELYNSGNGKAYPFNN